MIRANFSFALAAFCATWLLYHILDRLSRGFWKVFWIFFKNFSQPLFSRRGSAWALYHILSRLSRGFSKVFSTFFVFLFSGPLSQFPALKRLAYYSTFISFCQQVFAKFFEFGASGRFAQTKGKSLVQLAQQMSILVPNGGMLGVCNAHFPRLQSLHAAICVLNHDAHAPRGRSVHHEGLDELIIHI